MKPYSDFPARRAVQIALDAIALASIAVWLWLGATLYSIVMVFAEFGVAMQSAGGGFRTTMTAIGDRLGAVPFVGTGIRVPFDGASQAGKALEDAGTGQQEAVHALALALGIGVAALPILAILALWLIPRLRFARNAGLARAAARQPVGLELLALRALVGQKIAALAAIDADPVAAWRRGDPAIVRSLARLELRSAGVRLEG